MKVVPPLRLPYLRLNSYNLIMLLPFNFHFKKSYVIWIIVVIIIIFAYALLKRSATPQPVSSPPLKLSNPQFAAIQITQLSLSDSFQLPQLPNLTVYDAKVETQNLDQLAQSLATKFNLQKVSSDFWASADSSQFVSLTDTNILYAVDGNKNPSVYTGPNPPQPNPAIQSASAFISSLPGLGNLILEPASLRYFNFSAGHLEDAKPSDFNLIQLSFSQSVDQTPIRHESIDFPPATILVGQNNQVVKIEIISQPQLTLTKQNDYPPVTRSQLENAVASDSLQIIDLYSTPPLTQLLTQLPPTTITNATLEYRYSSQISQVFPFLRLTGLSTYDGSPLYVTFITPAIVSK